MGGSGPPSPSLNGHTSSTQEVDDDSTQLETVPLQNFDEKPVFIGADVEALYPNMDKMTAGEMMYRAVMESDIKFQGIDYEMLAIYLFLVMGTRLMHRVNLDMCIPYRRADNSKARSLGAKINRDKSEWTVLSHKFDENIKRMMIGRLLQILTIVLMSSSAYTFGGSIYLQEGGAGIGERASACIVKTIMSLWDKSWASRQSILGLWAGMFAGMSKKRSRQ